MTIEAICNEALDLVGYKRHIGSIWDGSVAARIALDAWGETRDALLEARPWEWARGEAALVASGTPPSPWSYKYTYPDNTIKLLQVRPGVVVRNDPQPVVWREMSEETALYVLADLSPAVAVITTRVLDVALWSPEFTEMMVIRLAEKFRTALGAMPQQKRGADQ
jgi:hypothetical protein